MTDPYTTCDFIKLAGPCGKRCFGGRCHAHRKRESHTLCAKGCGQGTRSKTGFCSHCGWAQNDAGHRLKKEREAMDEFITSYLAEIYAEMNRNEPEGSV